MRFDVYIKSGGSAGYEEAGSTPGAAVERTTRVDSRSDGRVQRSRERVLITAFELLSETGLGGFSVDEAARRSGVAKTTIYRHWPSRGSLVLEAAARISAEQDVPDTGSLETDLTTYLTHLRDLLSSARWSSVVPSLVDVAKRDPDFANLHGTIQRGHAVPLRQILERAVGRGQIPATAEHSRILSALIGPLYYRRWFSREPIDEIFVKVIVADVVNGECSPERSSGGA